MKTIVAYIGRYNSLFLQASIIKSCVGLLILLVTTLTSCQSNDLNNNKKVLSVQKTKINTSKYIQEKALVDYIYHAKNIKPNPNNGKPFDLIDYDKIIAYDFEGTEEPNPSILDNKQQFAPVVLAQQFLTQRQADNILTSLSSESTYGEGTAACFNPRFALVFYKNNKKVNKIDICLDCNYLEADFEIPAVTHKKVNQHTDQEYSIIGFTDSGRKAIVDLCHEIHFRYGRFNKK
ncbi:MAG: hypothetical protein HYZ42_04445 [Bacteroidetes bacterium]|nr:hypothetical protein [Bacteroidota bacterium]